MCKCSKEEDEEENEVLTKYESIEQVIHLNFYNMFKEIKEKGKFHARKKRLFA